MDSVFSQPWLQGGLIILIGYPLLVLVLSELVQRLARAEHPLASAMLHIRNVTLPLGLLLLFLRLLLDYKDSAALVKVVFTALLFSLVFAAISVGNIIFFTKAESSSWRANVPKLFLDLSRAFVAGVGFVLIVSVVWKSDLGGLVTALGVSSLVVGLALQDTLGNLFAGIALLFDKPFAVGDVIQVGDQEGKVIGITWRSVRLLINGNQSVLVIPNNVLGKDSFINLSRPRMYIERIPFRTALSKPPNLVKRVLHDVATHIPGVLESPAPSVTLTEEGGGHATYQVTLALESCEERGRVSDEFLSRAWYAAERHGFSHHKDSETPRFDNNPYGALCADMVGSLSRFSVLAALNDESKKELATHARVLRYAAGEIVMHEGATKTALYLIAAGEALLSTQVARDSQVHTYEVLRLGQGEIVGIDEVVLGMASQVTVSAASDLVVIEVPRAIAAQLIDRTPRLSRDLGEAMELRRRAIALAKAPHALTS